jgi:hypothetical protein
MYAFGGWLRCPDTRIQSCFGSRLHVGLGYSFNDDGIGSVLLFTLFESVAGGNGQSLASAVKRKCSNGVIVLPRLLQTPPVDSVPHDDIAVTATSSKSPESRMKCYGINRVNNVKIFGFVGNAVALEGVPRKVWLTINVYVKRSEGSVHFFA